MPRRMMIVVDGASEDSAATNLGLDWAGRFGFGLMAVGVVDLAALSPGEMVPPGAGAYKWQRDQHAIEAARRRVADGLDEMSRRCKTVGVPCTILSQEENDPGQVLRDTQRCDLMIMRRDPMRLAIGG